MDKHDIERIKRQTNIVDIVSQYVPLKKNGKSYVACCPFHAEKTPSFTVDEGKQFYHCFGCGAHGDVYEWMTEYCGMDFIDAYKALGGEIDMMPPEQVARNEKRVISKYKVPDDHKEDGDLANRYIAKCVHENVGGVDFFKYKGGYMLPIYNAEFELINAVNFRHGERMSFIAGGLSYGGFTPIRINDSDKWLACVSLDDGRYTAHDKNINVAVCWDMYSVKYLSLWNHGDMKVWPVIRECDDDYLCYEMNWVKLNENKEMEKMKCLS